MAYKEVFPFDLSDWQQRALQSIEDGNHCLVTAPTGSGKTVPAEYAIHYFTGRGKKVIYTSPIKALSNQKYYEFQQKFPNVSFGILTGDIKDNPEADVLIMTTEILCNHLHNLHYPESKLEFNINLEDELGCVVFDEVHYINDVDRGTVWEECFMLLPEHIQLVMLSATIATPNKFASWIESIHEASKKKVLLCDTSIRSVPLSHFVWVSAPPSSFNPKDKKNYETMERICNKPALLYSDEQGFSNDTYRDMNDACNHLQGHVKRKFVLNSVVGYLKTHEMLPAICFVYSRKNVEKMAKEVTHHLNDSVMMTNVEKECRDVISRFPNAKEYMALTEYKNIVKLLEKGIGIHHSGLLPVFREMIEILFTKGYVKMLFATETFAVGLNMPTKTVLFTSLKKYDGREHRYLLSHEYTQQAGRAGRRGYDLFGSVIHLSNLSEPPSQTDYKILLGNVPQKIVSRLKISYSMVLNCQNVSEFVNKSAIQHDIQKEIKYYQDEIDDKTKQLETVVELMVTSMKTPIDVLNHIINTEDIIVYCKPKKRKEKQRELDTLYEKYPSVKKDLECLHTKTKLIKEIEELENRMTQSKEYVDTQIHAIQNILEKNEFVDGRADIARAIKETHPLMMTDMLKLFSACDALQLIGLFSCFTNINVSDEFKNYSPSFSFEKTLELVKMAQSKLDYYYNEEIRTNIYSGADYNIHFDLVEDVIRWCKLTDEKDCEHFLLSLQREKGIFIGEFVKAVLKINAIANEMEKICEMCGMNDVQHILSQIGELTLKSVCTNQSLYV